MIDIFVPSKLKYPTKNKQDYIFKNICGKDIIEIIYDCLRRESGQVKSLISDCAGTTPVH